MGHRVFLHSMALLLIISAAAAHATTGHGQAAAAVTLQDTGGGVGSNSMMRAMVGSRPPSCAGRCWWCGGRRCFAVQVPITPQQDNNKIPHPHGAAAHGRTGASSSPAMMQKKEASSYDDGSNYKPLSWRCKCGGDLEP